MRLRHTPLLASLGWLACVQAAAQIASAPVDVRIPFEPSAATSNGETHLAYELHVTNFYRSTGTLRLQQVEVFAPGKATPLATRDAAALAPFVVQPRATPPPADPLAIDGGMRAVVYLWVTLPAGDPVPTSLRHRLVFRTDKGAEESSTAHVNVRRTALPVLGPPFRDRLWLVANGPGNQKAHHWGGLLAMNGRVTIPQRFAMDLIGLDDDGNAVRGDFKTSTNADWIGYGADVLAVADGVVREMHDGAPEKAPFAPNPPTAPTAQASGGNYIVLEIGQRVFVFYAHFQTHSLTVKTGDRVRRGQVLGRLGNSGSTTAPHLHLHVTDTPDLQESEGLPFAFQSFEHMGVVRVEHAIGVEPRTEPAALTPKRREKELPLDSAVIRFRTSVK